MKVYKFFLLVTTMMVSACSQTLYEDLDTTSVGVTPDENVQVGGNVITVKKGTPIEFQLNGDPDFITFFSGEDGHRYAYRNKVEYDADDIISSELSFRVWSQYGYFDRGAKGRLKVLYNVESEEQDVFPGLNKTDFEADSLLVESFEWDVLAEGDALLSPSAHNKSAEAKIVKFPISKQMIGKKITLAIVRNLDKQEIGESYENSSTHEKETALLSTFHIDDMKITNKLKDKSTSVIYASTFGFTPLNMWHKKQFDDLKNSEFDLPADLAYGSGQKDVAGFWNLTSINVGNMTIRGCAVNGQWRYNWLVSDYINPLLKTSVDKGVKVKEISQSLNSYTYTYSQVGMYRATFLFSNSNYEESESVLHEFVVNVVE